MTDKKTKDNDFCWNRIGVWDPEGVRSCPKLKDVVHCRNCDEFIAGGRSLLDKEPDADYLEEWTEFIADEREDLSESADSVIVFRLENEWFAFPAVVFREIEEAKDIHKIPHKTDGIFLGLTNIKGQLQLCFSLKEFLGIEKVESSSESHKRRFLVVFRDDYSWVFPADEVSGIYKYDTKDVQNIPATVSKSGSNYTKSVFKLEGKTIGLLDDELIIYALKRRVM